MIARNKKEFESYFRQEILPIIRRAYEQDGRVDYPASREVWNNEIDALVKEGMLPKRAEEWVPPW